MIMTEENYLPSCSLSNNTIDYKLHSEKKTTTKKINLSKSEDEYKVIDQTVSNSITNKRKTNTLNKEFPLYSLDKRNQENPMNIKIQKLTKQIELIENKLLYLNNNREIENNKHIITNDVNDINYDSEKFIDSGLKSIKNSESQIFNRSDQCFIKNNDNMFIGSSINKSEHGTLNDEEVKSITNVEICKRSTYDDKVKYEPPNKKKRLNDDVKSMIFQNITDEYCGRHSKSISNQEIEMLLETSYDFDNEDFIHPVSCKAQICSNNNYENIHDLQNTLLKSKHTDLEILIDGETIEMCILNGEEMSKRDSENVIQEESGSSDNNKEKTPSQTCDENVEKSYEVELEPSHSLKKIMVSDYSSINNYEIINESQNSKIINQENIILGDNEKITTTKVNEDKINNSSNSKSNLNQEKELINKTKQQIEITLDSEEEDVHINEDDIFERLLEPSSTSRDVIILDDEDTYFTNKIIGDKSLTTITISDGEDDICSLKSNCNKSLHGVITLDNEDISAKTYNNLCKRSDSKSFINQECLEKSSTLHNVIILDDYSTKINNKNVCKIDAPNTYSHKISEKKLDSFNVSVGQFTPEMFFFGSENCRDVSINYITQSISFECHVMNNSSRNNSLTHSMGTHFSISDPSNCSPTKNSRKNIDNFVNEGIIDAQNCSLESNDNLNENSDVLNLSFASSEVERILESSNNISGLSDVSLLFMPSERDLIKHNINSSVEETEAFISPSLNNSHDDVSNKKRILQCSKSCLNSFKSSETRSFKSSSVVNNYEDIVKFFDDCDVSSIDEYSDMEDNLLTLSFENNSSLENSISAKNSEQLKIANNTSYDDQSIWDKKLKTQKLDSSSEACSSTFIVKNHDSLIYPPNNDHQYNKVLTKSMSEKQIQNNKFEASIFNNDIHCCTIDSSVKSNILHFEDKEVENLKSSNDDITVNCSSPKTLKNEISEKPYDPGESNKKLVEFSNFAKSDSLSEEMSINSKILNNNLVNTSELSSLCAEQRNLKVIDEVFNKPNVSKLDEKLYVDDSISPYITQSIEKSTCSLNTKYALARKAAANINVSSMGDKALNTYLTQQTMTVDVLKVLHKSLDTCPSSNVLMEDPKGLVVPLMPHQKHGIAWLLWRESQEPRGGILADDMGLGKTLSMISLVLKSSEATQDSASFATNENGMNDVVNGGTLVVCPASLLNQWENEVRTKLSPGLLNVSQYYGPNRNKSATKLAKFDLVITSYHVIMWDYKKKCSSPLFKIKWKRIILDEAHNIRNNKTQTSVAVCSMTSINRWAITGTPIHNKEEDFFTLLKFVGCKPFDNWPVWKRWVGNNDDAGKHRQALLVKSLLLRRTKEELFQFTSFKLPPKNFHTIKIELSKEEKNVYEQLLQFSSNLFATYLYDKATKEKVLNTNIEVQCKVKYFQDQIQEKEAFKGHPELQKLFRQFKNIVEIQTSHILVLLLRLRQICCHPCLIKGRITEKNIEEDNEDIISEEDNDTDDDEPVDVTFKKKKVAIGCLNLCDVITDLTESMNRLTLKERVKNSQIIDSNTIFKKTWISSKIKAVCDMVWEKVLINSRNEKAVIVSQWPSMLYLIRKNLSQYNIKMEMFSGAISVLQRNKIVREFNNPNGEPQILLLSLSAGGVGLNLMAANHMFLVDIHWNPQLEAQACDRIYRLGQTKPVHVYKFICNNTIETRILVIQSLKLQIAQNLLNGGANVNSSKITLDDLKHIFQFN